MSNEIGRRDDHPGPGLPHDFVLTLLGCAGLLMALVSWKLASAIRPPAESPLGTIVVTVLIFGVVAGAATWLGLRFLGRRSKKRTKGFADKSAVTLWASEASARAKAPTLRPALSPAELDDCKLDDFGFPIATTLDGTAMVVSLEDHVGVCAPTGAGKTTGIMVPAVISSPGPTIVTATRAELIDLTVHARQRAWGSRPWVFDPLNICSWPHAIYWDPVAACVDAEKAEGLAMAFIFAAKRPGQESGGNSEFFNKEAASILKVLLHAAALDGKNMGHVVFWAKNIGDRWQDAADIITTSANPLAEKSWVDDLKASATGTTKSTGDSQKTLNQLISPVGTTSKLAWLTPSKDRAAFDPSAFVTSTDTLYIVCDSNRPHNLAPLCSMLLQAVIDAGKTAASRTKAGRLPVPIRLCGDELTNVAPLPTFPDMLTDFRGWGMQVIAAWQSDAQLKQRWGDNGAQILNDNLTVEMVLPGVRDDATLRRVSKLAGEVGIMKSTMTTSANGVPTSVGAQTLDKAVLRPDEVRRLGEHYPDQALLVHRTMSAVMVRLPRWFDGPDAIQLSDDQESVSTARYIYATPGA